MPRIFLRSCLPWFGLASSLLLACSGLASAQTPASTIAPVVTSAQHPAMPRLRWNPLWPAFRPIGYALTAASVTGALASTFLIPYPAEPRWVGGILFDNELRSALHARSSGLRDGIRYASDVTLIASLLITGLVDGIIIPVADRSWEVGWQLTLMNAQALSLNILIATILFKAVARGRPTHIECASDRSTDPLCDTGEFASFPSSHTSTAFTAAGLTCVHHEHLPLYGGQPWDTAACAGSIVLAFATGLFRVIGDRHYASDVLLGAAMGFSLGYLYPYLLHYQYDERELRDRSADEVQWGLTPGAAQAPLGLSLVGQF